MRLRVTIFGTLGVFSTAIGVAILAMPAEFRRTAPIEQLVDGIATVPQTGVLFVTGAFAAGYIVLAARSRPQPEPDASSESGQNRFETVVDSPPEAVTADRETVTAAGIDERVEEAVEGSEVALMQVRSTLRTLAARTYEDAAESASEDEQRAIRTGQWTADAVVAGFLAGPDGPAPPLWSRLRLWLTPERERRRRIERTLAVIESQADS